eukprot:scaffold16139_cov125-Isochrysis_galbana.AAC.2
MTRKEHTGGRVLLGGMSSRDRVSKESLVLGTRAGHRSGREEGLVLGVVCAGDAQGPSAKPTDVAAGRRWQGSRLLPAFSLPSPAPTTPSYTRRTLKRRSCLPFLRRVHPPPSPTRWAALTTPSPSLQHTKPWRGAPPPPPPPPPKTSCERKSCEQAFGRRRQNGGVAQPSGRITIALPSIQMVPLHQRLGVFRANRKEVETETPAVLLFLVA